MKPAYSYFLIMLISYLLSGCSSYRLKEARLNPQYVSIQQGQMEYYLLGEGSPIVLIPGYATDVSSWSSDFLKALSKNHQLIVLNNRHVGGSCIHSMEYNSRDLATDVAQLIQGLELKKPAVLGISMGGMIALQLAVLYPKHVGQLILINTAISGQQSVHPSPQMEQTLLNIPHNTFGFYKVAVNSFFPPSWKIKMAWKLALNRFQPRHYNPINLDKIIPHQQKLIQDWAIDDATAKKISQLSMSVLILNGKADAVIPPINSTILAQIIPHAQLFSWEDGGHAMIYQYPKQIADRIDAFIIDDF